MSVAHWITQLFLVPSHWGSTSIWINSVQTNTILQFPLHCSSKLHFLLQFLRSTYEMLPIAALLQSSICTLHWVRWCILHNRINGTLLLSNFFIVLFGFLKHYIVLCIECFDLTIEKHTFSRCTFNRCTYYRSAWIYRLKGSSLVISNVASNSLPLLLDFTWLDEVLYICFYF
jgi:hypothetical protein